MKGRKQPGPNTFLEDQGSALIGEGLLFIVTWVRYPKDLTGFDTTNKDFI